MLKFRRLSKSFRYAFKGVIKIIHEEQNIQVQMLLGVICLTLGIFFQIKSLEWVSLIMVIGLVVLMETVNSAIERVADILKPRIDDYVKEIKDIMAGAVMIASFVSIAVGVIIFLPYIIKLFSL